jgi:hypothetical protein
MKIKLILGAIGLLLVVAVVAVLVVGLHLGDLVKSGMETVGPKVTKTTLTVDTVSLSLFAGSAGVKGLVLGNPEGYQALASIKAGNAAVSLAPGSVLSDKIVIHSIEVRAPEITFEGNPLGANNLAQILANIKGTTGDASQAGTNAAPASPASPARPAKKLEVDDFLVTGAQVHANLTGVVNKELTLTLPDIHLTDLGKGPEGITVAELTQQVWSQITAATVKALVQDAANLGKDLTNAARNAAAGVLQNSSNAVGENVDKLKKGLGGLLGK